MGLRRLASGFDGVGFATDAGPVAFLWTSTFGLYGVEPFLQPVEDLLRLSEDGPERQDVSDHPFWTSGRASPICAASVFWDDPSLGGRRLSVPVAVRLDFDDGPVWILAASPRWPEPEPIFVGGDDVMIVFARSRMRKIGFPNSGFTA